MKNITGQKLPTNPAYWEQVVFDQLTQQSPELANTIVMAEIKESDYAKGNATGYIVVAGGHAIVPLVIRAFRLKPFSTVLHRDMVKALSDRTIREIMFSPEFMDNKLVDPNQVQVYTDISRLLSPPATAGGTGTVQSNKSASRSTRLLGALRRVSSDTKIKIASVLEGDKGLLSACARLLPFDDILGELQKAGVDKAATSVVVAPVYIKKLDNGHYLVNGKGKTVSELPGLKECERSELLLTGEVLVPPDSSGNDAAITVLGSSNVEILKDPCVADVQFSTGNVLKGVYIPRVVTFYGKLTLQGLFVAPYNTWSYQENIAGKPLRDLSDTVFACGVPKMGTYGTFVHTTSHHALEPFYITSIYSISGSIIMMVNTMSGVRMAIEYTSDSSWDGELAMLTGESISSHFPVKRICKVGSSYCYVGLGKREAAARSAEEGGAAVGNVVDIKIASGSHRPDRFILSNGRENSQLMTKLACQAELLSRGLSVRQAKMLTDRAPISFIKKKAEVMSNRHPGAISEDTDDSMPVIQPGTNEAGGDSGVASREVDRKMLSDGAKLNDPEVLDFLLTIGVSDVDEGAMAYISSSIEDIRQMVDRLGRMLLLVTTSQSDLPEDSLRDLVLKADSLMWKIKDYTSQYNRTEIRNTKK